MTNEIAGVAKETVNALKSSPGLLMIVVLNVLMLGSLIYVARAQSDERREIRLKDDALVQMLTNLCGRRGEGEQPQQLPGGTGEAEPKIDGKAAFVPHRPVSEGR